MIVKYFSYETFVGFSNEMDEDVVVNVYEIIKQGIIHELCGYSRQWCTCTLFIENVTNCTLKIF